MFAVSGKRVVEKMLKDVIEKVFVTAEFAAEKLTEKVVRAVAPITALGHAQPAFLLQEVEKDNLPHELFGKVSGAESLFRKFPGDGRVVLGEFV